MLALLLSATPAFANDVADEAELLFELGADAYRQGDYRRALERFLASNRLAPNKNVVFNVARSYEKLGRYPEAHRYYLQALEGETDEAQARFIRAALEGLAPQVASVVVRTDPPGADVYLERKDLGSVGTTPRVLGLARGTYTVLVEKEGYQPRRVTLEDVELGEERRVELTLTPLLGSVRIEGRTSQGATVRVGPVTLTGCDVPCELSVPPGQHVLEVRRAGFRSYETLVDVRAERLTRVRPTFSPLTGAVRIEADEIGALIEIDGRAFGFTPALLHLPVGVRAVRISLAGYVPVEKQLVVGADFEQRLAVTLTRLEEVTAASRRKEAVADAPSSVSIISSEELRLFGYPTIAEAVRGLPGVYGWDDRGYASLGFRGLGRLGSYGNRVLVLYDEHPTNDNWVGSSYVSYDARTDLADVERIEVIRGPGSVLYGTNAFAGVVNVITRPARRRWGGEAGISAVGDGVGRVRVRGEANVGRDAELWLSAGAARGRGQEFVFDDPAGGPPITTPERADGFEAGTLQGRYTWRFLTAQWFAHHHEKHQPTGWFETLLGDPRARQRDSRAFVEVRAEPTLSPSLSSLTRVHLNHYRYRGFFPRDAEHGGLGEDRYWGSWAGLEQRFTYEASEHVQVTFGAEGQLHFEMDQLGRDENEVFLDDPDRTLQVGAAYGMVDYRRQRLHLSLGARIDAYSTFGSSINPRLAVIGQPYDAGNTKLLIGKAFRAPSIYELFYNDGGFTQVPSPNLEPENIWSIELEHSHRLSPTVQIALGAFTTRASDLILARGAGTATAPLFYANATTPLATAGLELSLRREWRQGFMLEAQYTLQRARFLRDERVRSWLAWSRDESTREVANVPPHMAMLKGAVPIIGRAVTLGSRLTLEAPRADRYELEGDEPQGRSQAFAIWDVVLSGYEPRTGVRWNGGVYNAFDYVVALPVSRELSQRVIPQRGRTLLLSADIEF